MVVGVVDMRFWGFPIDVLLIHLSGYSTSEKLEDLPMRNRRCTPQKRVKCMQVCGGWQAGVVACEMSGRCPMAAYHACRVEKVHDKVWSLFALLAILRYRNTRDLHENIYRNGDIEQPRYMIIGGVLMNDVRLCER